MLVAYVVYLLCWFHTGFIEITKDHLQREAQHVQICKLLQVWCWKRGRNVYFKYLSVPAIEKHIKQAQM